MLEKEVKSFGLNMRIELKTKSFDSAITSAFFKGNTKENLLLFYSDNSLLKEINPDSIIKIKFEIDTNPPSYATFDTKYKLSPLPYKCCLYDESSLFAGKIAAILCRNRKNRIKGRDLYDYIFYLSKDIHYNLKHLTARLQQAGLIDENHELTLNETKDFLNKRFDTIDYNLAKKDVIPFIDSLDILNLWSADFFKSITDGLKSK